MMEKKIVMIIDDDTDDRFFFKEALTEMPSSIECLEAKGSREAFELLRRAEKLPDFIFLDINMPIMDGRECLKELKKDADLKSIPVIMYSTSFTDKSIAEFRALGAYHYLNKPTDVNKLSEQILEAIKKPMILS
ncbi:MAG: response regulator [Chryseolinea sp.]